MGYEPAGSSSNATQLQGRGISGASPNNGDELTWDSGLSVWKPAPETGGGGGGGTWGSITGTLSDQTDLNTALGAKEPAITSGTTSQYWRGDKTFQTLNQAAVAGLTINDSPSFDGVYLRTGVGGGGSSLASGAGSASFVVTFPAKGGTVAFLDDLTPLAPLASPTFTGTVTIPSPFTLGSTSVTATGTELNYVAGVTSAIQTQLNGKQASGSYQTTAGTLALGGFGSITGTLPAANLPNPTASTLGGVESLASSTSKWINAISTSGVPSATQPAFSDLSSPPTTVSGYGITDAHPSALVLHADGTSTVYQASANTDAARATALRNAVTAAVSPEIVRFGAGTYALGATKLTIPTGVSLIGSGKYVSTITTATDLTPSVNIEVSNCPQMSNFTFNSGVAAAGTQLPIGNNDGTTVVTLNAENLRLITLGVDLFYGGATGSTWNFRRCDFASGWDSLALTGTVTAWNCEIVSTSNRAMIVSTANLIGCKITVTGGTSEAVRFTATGSYLQDTSITTDGTADIRTTGTATVVGGRGSGTNGGFLITTGTLVYKDSAFDAANAWSKLNTFNGGATISGSALTLSGNQSAAAWTTSGLRIKGVAGTLTDTTSSGTVASAYTDKLGGNTIAASSATTFTNYISLYMVAPVQGTNVTITNPYALGADSLIVGTSNALTVSTNGVLTATSPVFVTPALGTPASGVATNLTGIPAANITGTTLSSTVTASSLTSFGSSIALGTPASGTLTNCTFPTLNQNTTGSAASLSISGQTGLMTVTGLTSTNRAKTVRDAADTILELGGSYTPTGTWTSLPLTTPKVTTGIQDANANAILNLTATASAIEKATLGNAASGGSPLLTLGTATLASGGTASGLLLTNTNTASSGNQMYSPAVRWTGQGWKSDATTASQPVDFRAYVVPVQHATNPTGYFTVESSINGGAFGTPLNWNSAGLLQFMGTTNSFPAIKRGTVASAGIAVRLADDSFYSDIEAGGLRLYTASSSNRSIDINGFSRNISLISGGASTGIGIRWDNSSTAISGTYITGIDCDSVGIIQANSGVFGKWGGVNAGVFAAQSLATPTTSPTFTTSGTAGSTTISYAYADVLADGVTQTAGSPVGTITTANATLTGTNKVNLTLPAFNANATKRNIYRTATNGTAPTTTGIIGNITSGTTFSDTGLAGDSATAPTVNNTGAFTGQLKGSATNDNAQAGYLGEYVSSLIASGSAVSLTTATAANLTSISLTAGDWDVQGNINFTETTSTVTARSGGITTTSATVPTDGSECYNGVQSTVASETNTITLPRKRISVSSTTPVYLVGSATFSAGTCAGFGAITARRMR